MKTTLAQAEHYKWGENCDGWHLLKNDSLSVIQERIPPGGTEIRHYHKKSQQFFYVLKGVASFEMNGTIHSLNAEEGIEVAPEVPHQIKNMSNEDVIEHAFVVDVLEK